LVASDESETGINREGPLPVFRFIENDTSHRVGMVALWKALARRCWAIAGARFRERRGVV
jgi:hypothetical protein